jgi:hypothetical protein
MDVFHIPRKSKELSYSLATPNTWISRHPTRRRRRSSKFFIFDRANLNIPPIFVHEFLNLLLLKSVSEKSESMLFNNDRCNALLVICISYLSYNLVEKPSRRFPRNLLSFKSLKNVTNTTDAALALETK